MWVHRIGTQGTSDVEGHSLAAAIFWHGARDVSQEEHLSSPPKSYGLVGGTRGRQCPWESSIRNEEGYNKEKECNLASGDKSNRDGLGCGSGGLPLKHRAKG